MLRRDGIPEDPPSPLQSGVHARGYLPHVKHEGASYFITFRLADSLPQEVLLRFKREQAEAKRRAGAKITLEQETELNRDLQRKIERYLDKGVGACHLRRPEIADMVAEAILFFDDEQYVLDDWVVMPNHVHLIIW